MQKLRARLALVLLRAGSPEWAREVLNEATDLSWGMRRYARNGWPPTSGRSRRSSRCHRRARRDDLLAALTAFDEAIERDRESGLFARSFTGTSLPGAIMMRLKLQSFVLAD